MLRFVLPANEHGRCLVFLFLTVFYYFLSSLQKETLYFDASVFSSLLEKYFGNFRRVIGEFRK